jgi:hypothetical protein
MSIGKLLLFGAAIGLAAPGLGAAEKPETARAALERAKPRAKEWRADAVLTNASTLGADANGTAEIWNFAFYSPGAKTWLNVTASGGKLGTLEVSMGLADPVGEFIDSDQAIEAAKKNGLAGSKKPMMGLAWMGGSKDGVACWTVGGGFEPGSVGVVLDAKTGGFITKHETP